MRSAASSAARRARDRGDLDRHRVAPPPLLEAPLELAGAGLAEDLRRGVEAEHDPGLLLHDPGPGPRGGGHGRLGGDVAGADVLGERPLDQPLQLGACRVGGHPAGAREDRDRRGEAVQEVAPADRPDLAGAEEAGRGHAEGVLERGRVVVGDVEHVRAAAVAGEQQRPGRALVAQRQRLRLQRLAQVLVGGRAVAHVHADRLADPDPLADGEAAAVGVGAEDRADEEVAALVGGLVLVDDDPEHQALGGQRLLAGVELADRLAQALDRGLRGELRDHVAVRGRDRHLGPDRGRALRDARDHPDAGEARSDRATGEHLPVAKQRRRPGRRRARQPAEHRHPRPLGVERLEQRLGAERVRIGEQDQHVAEALGIRQPAHRDPAVARLGLEVVGRDPRLRAPTAPTPPRRARSRARGRRRARRPPRSRSAPAARAARGRSRGSSSRVPRCGAPTKMSARSQAPPSARAASRAARSNASTGSSCIGDADGDADRHPVITVAGRANVPEYAPGRGLRDVRRLSRGARRSRCRASPGIRAGCRRRSSAPTPSRCRGSAPRPACARPASRRTRGARRCARPARASP